jgi:hypothetical protein
MTRSKICCDVQGSISLVLVLCATDVEFRGCKACARKGDQISLISSWKSSSEQQDLPCELWSVVLHVHFVGLLHACQLSCVFHSRDVPVVERANLELPVMRTNYEWTDLQRPGEGDSSTHLRLATKQAEQKVGHARHGSGGCVREAIHSHGERARRGDGFRRGTHTGFRLQLLRQYAMSSSSRCLSHMPFL